MIYPISGMTCNNCLASVTAKLKAVDGGITVTLTPPQAVTPDFISQMQLENALAGTKYSVGEAEVLLSKVSWFKTYFPLLLIMGLISLVSLKEAYDFHGWMMSFMAGFFIVFGAFKLFDLQGFADAFQTYDIIAKRSRAYALAYPFIEIALGFAFLFHFQMRASIHLNNILMIIGIIGVVQALRSKQKIQCACLGTVLKLPMSTVTLVEDGLMLAMGLMML